MQKDLEVIVGRNENILVKIVYEDDVRKYVDVNNIEYTNVDITEKTGSSPKHLPATENNSEDNNLDQKLLW